MAAAEDGVSATGNQTNAGATDHRQGADDTSGSVIAQVASAAGKVGHDAKDKLASITDDVSSQAASAVSEQKDAVADTIDEVAGVLKRSADGLEGQQDWIAHAVEAGATELSSLAKTLRSNDLQGLMGSLQDLARRQPAVFVGAAMAVGFAAARLGKVAMTTGAPSGGPSTAAEVNHGRG